MSYGRRVALSVAVALGLVLVLVLGAVLIITQTDWGRQQVRGIVLDQLREAAEGEVEIGAVQGDLLRGVRLIDVSIVDTEGRPFVAADTISTRYSLWSLLSRRIVLSDLRLVNAHVVLDKPPGEEWNWVRIFPPDPEPDPVEPVRPGWGSWISLHDVTLVNTRVTVRTEWKPPEDATPAEQEKALQMALSGETRDNVVEVPGGYQNVMDFRELNAELPRVVVAHPDSAKIPIEVARFSGIVQPFRPPAAVVRDLSGNFYMGEDSLYFQGVQAVLPGSRVAAEGVYRLDSGDLLLQLHGAPVAFADLRWLYPPLPEEGGGSLRLRMERKTLVTNFIAEEMELRVGEGTVTGQLGLVIGDTVRLHDTDLRFSQVDTRLIDDLVPELELPRQGLLSGHAVLSGSPEAMRLDADVAFVDRVAGRSRVLASGEVGMGEEVRFRDLHLRLEPLQGELLALASPELPARGEIRGEVRLTGTTAGPLQLNGDLRLADPRTGVSRVLADGGVVMGEEVRLRDLRLRLEPLQVALVREFAPELPLAGTLQGVARLDGPLSGPLRLDSDLTLRDPQAGPSRVAATGVIGMGEEAVRFSDLRLRFDPVQVALARRVMPDLPIGGTVTGRATLNGSTATRLAVNADLVHRDRGELSHLTGTGRFPMNGTGPVQADLRLQPLSLVTVGRFAPAAGLRGSATGVLQARGELSDLRLQGTLRFPDGGVLVAGGWLDVQSEQPRYDLETRLQLFNLATLTERAPAQTSLTGAIEARGRGFDPATMRAEVNADLLGTRVDDIEADEVRLRLTLAEGLARLDPALVRMTAGEIEARGSFGLTAARQGELEYRVQLDSLAALRPWLPPPGEGEVAPRPAVRAEALERAAAERQRAERAAEVERIAAGRRAAPPPPPQPDTVPAIPRDALGGSIHTAGTLRGNVERFDLRGRAELEEVLFQGNYVGSGRADYDLREIGTPEPDIAVEAAFDSVLAAGFALDSVAARVDYRGARYGTGTADLAIFQDEASDLRANFDFALSLEQSELRLNEMALRFDTVTWRSAQPGVVNWSGVGVEVETIELQSDAGGRIFVDGRLPVEGAADLELVVQDLEIADVVGLLQAEEGTSGRLFLDARVQGTQASPRFEGEVELREGTLEGREIPDLQARFAYADLELNADAELRRGGLLLAEAEAQLPVNLALAEVEGPRLLDRPLAVEIRADSLPLDALPSLTDAVEDVRGRVVGNVSVSGTFEDPVLDGVLDLDLGSFRLVPVGVRFQEIVGTVRLRDDVLAVDSLVAWSGGRVRITGEMDLSTLTEPGFDLALEARQALVLDNEQGRVEVDADLEVAGPFDGLRITGDVRARRGVIYIPEPTGKDIVALDDAELAQQLDTLLLAEREALVEQSPLMQNLQVEVDVVIERDMWVRSTEANVEIYTPAEVGPLAVRMNGGTTNLTLEGTVNSDFGEYEFMSRRFRLTRGAVTFRGDPEINPIVQVAAEHEVRMPGREAIQIRIVIGGTVREPTVALESSAQPPIPQTDLLSYLAFGRESSSLMQQQGSGLAGQGTGSGNLVGNVAALATQQLTSVAVGALLSHFERDAARSLGLDVFRIAPADLPPELWTGRGFDDLLRGTEFEAGAYIRPRLFVAGNARPTTETLPGARIEYRTPGGFRWITSWEPRFLPTIPTLEQREPDAARVFGAFLLREWRF